MIKSIVRFFQQKKRGIVRYKKPLKLYYILPFVTLKSTFEESRKTKTPPKEQLLTRFAGRG